MTRVEIEPVELLGEVEDLLRTAPSDEVLHQTIPENFSWLGRVVSVLDRWGNRGGAMRLAVAQLQGGKAHLSYQGYNTIMLTLYEASSDLRLSTLGPVNTAIDHGAVFDYFDEIRRLIEPAQSDLLFVDPYLDADFVPRYLPHVRAGVAIRLLGRERIATLTPALQLFAQQSGARTELRSAAGFHDRYLIVDRTACYQSGASFKDGGRKAPTTITQVTDAFVAIRQTYEDLWASGKVIPL